MKFREKIYRVFCADEVKMMLDHMEENFADFQDYDNKWCDLIDARHYTTVERSAIKLAFRRLKASQERQKLLGAILRQKIDPIKGRRKEEQVTQGSVTLKALNTQQQAQYYQQQLQMGQLGQYGTSLQNYNRP